MGDKQNSRGGDLLAEAVRTAYKEGHTDYNMEPLVQIDNNGNPVGIVEDGDAVIFCCRRGEREIELTEAFTDPTFPHFEQKKFSDLDFAILTMYHEKFKDLPIAFAPSKVDNTLADTISRAGLRQLHCAESEKFAHVTYFFNGGKNDEIPGEVDIRIPSPKGVPFDQVPQLSLPEVADKVIDGLKTGYDFIITNFANGDVIGHTSNNEAKVECAEYVDAHLGRVIETAKEEGYVIAITADHGNLEVMITGEGKPHVAHTSNPVPFILIDTLADGTIELAEGRLCDVAPTVLQALGIEKPGAMTGESLAKSHDFGEKRHVLLIVLDGWGIGKEDDTNPICIAKTPVWDNIMKAYPSSSLGASGTSVGLQEGKAGNSEAGHINMGSGRVVKQDDVRLDEAMKDGSFESNEVFLKTIDNVRRRGTALHLLALLTKKSSHGSIDYPLALLKMARDLPKVYVHIIFDGRSTEPGSAPALLEELDGMIREIGAGQIVGGVGRGIALDRDRNYPKVKKAYDSFAFGYGKRYS